MSQDPITASDWTVEEHRSRHIDIRKEILFDARRTVEIRGHVNGGPGPSPGYSWRVEVHMVRGACSSMTLVAMASSEHLYPAIPTEEEAIGLATAAAELLLLTTRIALRAPGPLA